MDAKKSHTSLNYSIAIRTLGKNPETLQIELESIWSQLLQPQKVVIYIAEGYNRPEFQIGNEEYVWVKKGMVAQRALSYDEIDTDYIMLLDDDIELAPDSTERMLNILTENDADCVGADVFASHGMSIYTKLFALLTNFVRPRFKDDGWADRICLDGSLSYTNKFSSDVLKTETVGGPCSVWRKEALLSLNWQDELWMDSLSSFAFGDDMVETYKLFVNGGRLLMDMNTKVKNLDSKTSSSSYRNSPERFYTRSIMAFCNWYRAIYSSRTSNINKLLATLCFCIKATWLFFINILACIYYRKPSIAYYYLKGIYDGWLFVHSEDFAKIRPYRHNKD